MKFYLLIFALFLSGTLPAQTFYKLDSTFHDGPYVFFEEDHIVARWVHAGQLKEDTVRQGAQLQVASEVCASFDPSILDPDAEFEPDSVVSYEGVNKLVAISDIHGQYDLMLRLLKAHGVIDEANAWSFGEGHLVVVGDIFDRGANVTDILWLIYKLENEAKTAGGKVHYLLGNHEVMNLNNDLRYVNKRYRYTMAMLRTPYPQLFGRNTYLGKWIRTKPVAISINDMVFVHAGFSATCLDLGLSFEEMNTAFQEQILGQTSEYIETDPALRVLNGEDGPIWYRGYFQETFSRKQAKALLKRLGKKHIIIGHTPLPEVTSFFKRRIIGVDSTIQLGKEGEVLIYEEGSFFRGRSDGKRIKLR